MSLSYTIADFWDDWWGVILGLGIVVLMVGLLAWAVNAENEQRNAACARMWAATRTSADTVAVIGKCELGPDTQVVPVPVVIPMGGR